MKKCVEAEQLTFQYSSMPVLEDVSFSILEGDFVGIIGANGAGKSTLLKLLLGELAPTSGSIKLFEQDARTFKNWPEIGYLPQNAVAKSAGFPATAQEIIKANLFSQIGLLHFPKKAHQEKVIQALRLVGMEHCAKSLIGNLSGGQQQRIMLARLLVAQPQLMLLDEPTSGLDVKTAQGLYELLQALNQERGLTVMMVTHDIAKAAQYVGRTLCLEDASMVELDKQHIHEELQHKHKHPVKSNIYFQAHFPAKEKGNGNF